MKFNTTPKKINSGIRSMLMAGICLLAIPSFAQNLNNYTFSAGTSGSLVLDANGNSINMNSDFVQLIQENSAASTASALLNMNLDVDPAAAPFEFWFNGTRRTQFSVSSSGLMRLDATLAANTYPVASAPLIAPFHQTSSTSRTGYVRAKVVGSAPNRTLVVEWRNMRIPSTSTTADGTFQARLYEGTGVVEFVYGQMWSTGGIAPVAYNIGIASSNTATTTGWVTTASNSFTVTNTATPNPAPTAATTITNLHSTSDGNRRTYTFTPSVTPSAPSSMTFASVSQTAMTVGWTDNASNEVGYALFRSDDGGTTYNMVNQYAANVQTSGAQSNLIPGKTYYWKVYVVSEGGISGALSGNQATTAATTITSTATGGNWSATGTWVGGVVPSGAQYDVVIANGATVTINGNYTINNLTVGQGTSGILQFDGTARTLTVNGDITVAAGATFRYPTAAVTSNLYIGGNTASTPRQGNLTVDGTLDFHNGATTIVNTYFYGGMSSSISGTGAIDFNLVYLNKGPLTAAAYTPAANSILEVNRGYTFQGANTGGPFSTITSGTLKINGSFNVPVFNANPTIPAAGGFWLNNSSYNVVGSTTGQTGMTNNGLLKISDGTLNIGNTTSHNLILGNNSVTIIESGTVNVSSRMGSAIVSPTITYPLYKQTNGTVNVATSGNATTTYGSFDMGTYTYSYFEMSGGSITTGTANSGATKLDIRGGMGSCKITGGSVTLGSSTLYYIAGSLPDFDSNGKNATLTGITTLWGNYTNPGTLVTGANSITFRGSVPAGGTITATNGTVAFYGSSAQTLGGTLTTPLNLIVNNASGVTIPTTTMSTSNATLWLLNGTLSSSGTLTLGGAGTTITKVVRDNGSLAAAPTLNLSTSAIHTLDYLYLGNSTGSITTDKEYFLNGTNTATILTINNYNGVELDQARYAGKLNLFCGQLKTTPTNLMTVINSAAAQVAGHSQYSYVNGPLNRAMPSIATGTWSFPVGTASTYALFDLPVSTATGNTLNAQVEYKESASGGSAGTGLSSLIDRYWKVDKTAGSGNLTNFLPVVTTSGLTVGTRLGYSATLTGSYDNISAAPVSGTLTAITPTTITGAAPQTAYYTLANSGTLSGTITSGPSYTYKDLAAVAFALRTQMVTGNVVFEFTGYTGENVPNQTVTFYPFTKSGGNWTATIRPASGESGFETKGDPGSGLSLIDFNGIDSLTIDGRPGGTGSSIEWTFRNTRTAATVGPTFRFVNDATFNTLNYLNIQSQNITATSGTIFFNGTTGTLGNSDNTISNCHIRDRSDAAGLPVNGIYSLGTASYNNARNTISNNLIYNNFVAGTGGAGIWLGLNNIAWTITANHFYQTASRTATAGARYGIYIANTNAGSTNFNISGNYIGGSQANAGGTAMTYSGNVNQSYVGIYLSSLAAGNNLVENNTIKNIALSHGAAANTMLFAGIYDLNGNNTFDNNTIGGLAVGDAITVTSNFTTASATYGIYLTSGTDTVTNNTIAGISLTSTTGLVGFTGIYLGNAANLIVDNNTITKIAASYSGATANGFARGIVSAGSGTRTITNNTIYDLSTATTNTTGTGATAVTAGIIQQSTTQGHTISGNKIYDLKNTAASAATNICGFFYNGATSGTNNINGNFVHSMSLTTTGAGTITGMQFNSGVFNVTNNMVRLGIDANGNSITGGYTIRGIQHVPITINSVYYYNTVYLGGGSVTGSAATYAFNRTAASGAIFIKNNIFYNARSNSTGTGKHYAIGIVNMTGITAANVDYNYYHAGGTGGYIGQDATNDRSTLSDWQGILANLDKYSITGNLNFVNATGNASMANVHINPLIGTQVESAGTAITGYDTDYDGDYRFNHASYSGTGTAPDIGADENNFIPIDLTPPSISISTPAAHTCNSATTATLSATIVDASDVALKSGDKPRVYYKKTSNTNAFNDNTNSTDGWKWVEASNSGSPFNFSIDLTKINGGYVPGEVIQYFVTAQDTGDNVPVTPNVGASPVTFAATPSSVALTSAAFPVSGSPSLFAILPCQGTVTVGGGSGDNYSKFTVSGNLTDGTAGIFQAINAATLAGDLKIQVSSDISGETGAVALNQNAGVYNIRIESDAATTRNISGSAATALFKMDGADNVRFNGGSGSNQYLKFTNTATNGATFQFINDATSDTLNNLIVEGSSNSVASGVIFISNTTGTTGNDNIRIENCDIKEAGSNLPANGIFSSGTSGKTNDNIVVKGCNISNYFLASATTAHAGVFASSYNSGWTVENNKFFQTASRAYTGAAAPHSAIYIGNPTGPGGGFTVKGNTIGYSSAAGTGSMTYTSAVATQYAGIYLNVLTSPVSEVSNNTIQNISYTSISAGTANQGLFTGIYILSGAVNVLNNTIGAASGTGSISVTLNTNSGGYVNGIKNDGAGPVNINNNTIGSITTTGVGTNVGVNVFGIHSTTGNVSVRNNNIGSATTPNSIQSSGTLTTNLHSVEGIRIQSPSVLYTDTVINNTVTNLNNLNTGTNSTVRGIYTLNISTAGLFYIANNTVSKLNTAATGTGATTSSVMAGIVNTSTGAGLTITGNNVFSLSASASSAASSMMGIFSNGATTGTNNLTKNFVHSLKLSTSSNSATITGIQVNAGLVNVVNNMVRLGIDAGGSSVGGDYVIRGIYHVPTTASSAYYYNTVYLGGTVSSGSNKTYSFNRTAASGNIYIKNNIFYNERSGGTGNHFAVGMSNMSGIAAANVNYNLLYGGKTGEEVSTVRTTLNDWRGASGTPDLNSITGALHFVDATGDTNDVDLHIDVTYATQIESAATTTGVGTWGDYDNEKRFGESGYSGAGSAPDIGADENDFTPLDLTPPTVTISTPAANICNTATTATLSATITDASDIALKSGDKPRAYYKSVNNSNAFNDNTNSTDGWKWVEASNSSSPFSFTLDLTKIYNGIKAGFAIQYFVVAQDSGVNVLTPNVGISAGAFAATPSSVALTSSAFPITGTLGVFVPLPCQGTVTVGNNSTDNYKAFTISGNLTDGTAGIFQAINATTLTGQLNIQVTSDISIETGVVALNQNAGVYNIRILPDGATLRSVSGSAATALFKMDGADNVRFSGGTGSNQYLKFTNTATNGATFQFINDATSDTLNNLIVEGSSNSVASGVIFISTTTGTTGNDSIRIENCDIKEAGSNLPANGIFSSGTSGKTNDNIVVKGCNISNYFLASATTAHAGVFASSYNSGWTVENNKFFQTASRAYTGAAAPHSAIYIGNPTGPGGGFTVKGNTIGYSSAAGTGFMTYTSAVATQYAGIYLNVLTSPVSEVSNNTIKSIAYTSTSTNTASWGQFSGIYIFSGAVNVLNNTIGSSTGTGSLTVSLSATNFGSYVNGIKNDGAGPVKIYNNTVGSISATGSGTNAGISVFGIQSSTGNVAVRNNNVGSTTTPNSIQSNGTATTTAISVEGIRVMSPSVAYTDTIAHNTVSNLNNLNTGTSTTVRGIYTLYNTTAGSFVIDTNIISKLYTASTSTGVTANNTAIIGIANQSTASGTPLAIRGNKVHSLAGTASSAATTIMGIFTNGATSGTNNVTNNFVHSLKLSTSNNTATILGIHINAGVVNAVNNMVRLGYDAGGNSVAGDYVIKGISQIAATASAFYYNTVYIGGTVSSGSKNSYAYSRSASAGNVLIKNNIFYNERSGGTGNHIAIATASLTGFSSINVNYNLLYAAVIGEDVSARTSLPDWRSATGTDLNSIGGALNFVDATGDTNDVDLHINNTLPTQIESAGTTGIGSWADYDNDVRYGESGYSGAGTAPDIGADEDDFTPLDINPPAISISTPPADVCNSASGVTLSATITDGSSIKIASGTRPRVYYKKSDNANTFNDNTNSTDGWKWVEASNTSSPFSFTLDFSKVYNGVSPGTPMQYFVVAQDSGASVPVTPNVGISTGTFAATPSSVALTAAAFPISGTPPTFAVLPCSGTVTVGIGGNYEGFTPNGGLFQAINATAGIGGLTGNLIVNVISDVAVENGVNALNQWTGAYTVTIQPGSSSVKTISNAADISSGTAMIPINGADGLTITGKYSGSGQYLRFRNTRTTASNALPTIAFYSGASGNLLENCIVENNSTNAATGSLLFGTGNNSNNTVSGNTFTAPSGGTVNNPANHIYSNNTNNSGINIQANDFNNFNTSGILLTSGATWTIGGSTAANGNNFYQTASIATAHTAISVGVGTHTVQNNRIGGNATPVAYAIQGTWTNTGAVAVKAIEFSSVASGTIADNTIQNFSLTNTGAPSFIGISTASSQATTVSGNTINNISISGATGAATITAISNTGSGAATIQTNSIGSSGKTLINSGTGAVKGIFSSSSNASTLIGGNSSGLGNTVSYLEASNASAQILGIHISGAASAVQYNSINALNHSGANTGAGASASVIGILQAGSNAQTTANNNIYGLNSSANAAVNIVGILTGSAQVHTLAANNIHNFASSYTTSVQQGINLATMSAGTVLKNNMVALGIDGSGSAITNSVAIAGIAKASTNAANIYHNSVYIGGSGISSGTVNTFAFQRTANASDDIRNNIFANARSNSSGTARHFAMVLNSTTIGNCDYNIYYAPGTGGSLASVNGGSTALDTYQALRYGLSGQNMQSGVGNPSFNAPASGNANLHLNNGTPAEGMGVAIGSVTDDYDGQTRSGLTPTDIGADAGDFGTPGSDIFYPAVTVSAVSNQAVCSGTLDVNIVATVTDAGSGLASGSYAPQLWWRLSAGTGSPTAWAKIAASSVTGNDFTFNLTYSPISGGQTFQYYVAAQDQAGNIFYSNFDASTPVHSDVATAPSTANANPASFNIIAATPLNGSVTVGTGGTYTTLTGAGGLFAAINTNGLDGDLVATIISDITETGANTLNQWSEYCGGPYALLIQPDGNTVRTLSGSVASNLIGFNGADRVTIDGSYSGSGQYLKFSNSNTSGNTFLFQNGTTYFNLLNCIVEGQPNQTSSYTKAIINIGGTASNNNIIIKGNKLGSSSYANHVIYSAGASGDPNHHISIENNEIFNFLTWSGGSSYRSYGINVTATGNGSNWTIRNNSIYNTGINVQSTQTAIGFFAGSASTNDTISGNWIGGSSAQCGTGGAVTYWGNSWDNYSSGENQVRAISLNCGDVLLDNNNITNILVSNGDYSGFVGILIEGSTVATISNNVMGTGSNGQPDNAKIIRVNGGGANYYVPGYIYGIWNKSTTSSMSVYSNNDFYYLHQAGNYEGGQVQVIFHNTAGPATISGNRINGPQANGAYYNQFGIRFEPTASTSGNVIEKNIIAGPFNTMATSDNDGNNFGIYARSNNGLTHSGIINKNVIWDMRSASYGGRAATEGIYVSCVPGGNGNGNWDITNNMVTLKNNNSSANCVALYGIDVALNSSSNTKVQYNTVYIGGSNGGTGLAGNDFSSFAFFRHPGGSGTVTGDKITLQNNIFINSRLVSTLAVTCHCAIANLGSSNYATNWDASDYNFLFTNNGSKSYIGVWGTTVRDAAGGSISQWKSSSGKDANSYTATVTTGNSNFGSSLLNPDVDGKLFANTLSDLHIATTDGQSSRFVDNRANPISITTDFDGQTRSGTAPDIGADEFGTTNDAGIIAVKPTCSGSAVEVTIKNFGSVTLNSVTVNWKVNGTSQTSANFSSMGLASGATVVKTINLSSPASFTAATAYNVWATTVNPNGVSDEDTGNDAFTANPLYYGMGSTVYVGSTGSPKFSTYNELFAAINNSVLTANLSVVVNANTTEPSTPTFLNAVGYCGGDRTITITPSSATIYTATGNSGIAGNEGMIGFNGAANVTIDGRSGGSGNYLRFRNTNSSMPVFHFREDAEKIMVRNTTIEGNNSTKYVSGGVSNVPGVVFFGNAKASGNGNRNITLTYNKIRDRSDATGVPSNMIFSYNSTSGTTNNAIKVLNNEVFNFSQTGVYLPDNAGNGPAWNISGNSFYCTSNMASYQSVVPQHIAIYLKASTSHTDTIKQNYIGGSAANASGTWSNSSSSLDFEGIRLEIGGSGSQITRVDSNTIKNINLSGTGLSGFMGIRVKTGLVDITGNTIGDLSATLASPSIAVAGSGTPNSTNDNVMIFGIWNYSRDASTISNNVIAGIKSTAPYMSESGHAYTCGIRRGAKEYGTNATDVYAGKSIIRGNTIANLWSESSLSNVNMTGKYQDKVWPAAVSGIALRSDYVSDNRVDSNTVYGLFANATWNRWVRVHGIALNAYGNSDAGIVSKNRVYDLKNYNGGVFGANSYTPAITGISVGAADLTNAYVYVANGSYTLINNMVYLAPEVHPTKPYNNPDLYGILDATKSGNTTKYYYNTIYISGAGKNSLPADCPVMSSYGYMRSAAGNGEVNGGTVHMKNNIIINNRTGYVDNIAICNNTSNPATGWSGSNIDYNFLSTGNTNRVGQRIVGNFQTGTLTNYTFSGWKSAFSCDANSKYAQTVTGATPSSYTNDPSVDVVNPGAGYLFIDPTDIVSADKFLHIDETDGNSSLFVKENATPVSGITTDFDEESRDASKPTIGADELSSCPAPVFVTQPANLSTCPGDTIFFVKVTSASAETYQWAVSTDGGSTWSNLSNGGIYSGVSNDTLRLTGLTNAQNNYQYRVVVENACKKDTSTAATLTVNNPPSITSYTPVSFNNTICEGSNTLFGVVKTGSGTLSALWQLSTDGGTSWSAVSNGGVYSTATTDTLRMNNVPRSLDGNKYRVIISSSSCAEKDTSIVGNLSVMFGTVTSDPVATVDVCSGSTAKIGITATTHLIAQTYEWQLSTNGGATWSFITAGPDHSGYTTDSLTLLNPTAGYKYRAIVNRTCGADTSTVSTVGTLKTKPVVTYYEAGDGAHDIIYCTGTQVLKAKVTGTTPGNTWQVSTDKGATWSNLSNGAPYTIYAASDTAVMNIYLTGSYASYWGNKYRLVSSNTCGSDTTAAATLYRGTSPSAVTQPKSRDTLCSGTGQTLSFGYDMLSQDTTILWQYYNGVSWQNVTNGVPVGFSYVDPYAASLQLSTTSSTAYGTYRFRSRIIGSCGSLNSDTARIVIRNAGQWLGYTNAWETVSNWGCGTLPDLTVNVVLPTTPEGGNQPVVSSTGTALANDLFLMSGSSLTVNSSKDIGLAGNINNNGTASFGAGIVRMKGTVKQTVGGSTVTQFGELYVDNSISGDAIELNQDMTVNTKLNMLNINGNIDLNGYEIALGTNGEITNESNSNRIYDKDNDGGTVTATRTLSAGTTYTNANLGGIGLNMDIKSSSAAPGSTQIVRRHESMITGSGTSIIRAYEIHASTGTGLNLNLGIGYFDAELPGGGTVESDLIPWRLPDGGDETSSADWQGQFFPTRISHNIAGTSNWVNLDSVTAFSTWTLSDWNTEPLPVQLLSFNATANHQHNQVDLTWQTASEVNNDFFTVQRSKNAVDFEDVLVKDGAGNSNTVRNYTDVDGTPYTGVSYYRLKQTDFNGKSSYSDIVPVAFNGDQQVYATSWVNQDRNIQLLINDHSRGAYDLKLFDAAGKLVLVEQINTGKGINQHLIYNPGLAPGIYMLRMEGTHQTYIGKLFIR